MTMCGMSAAHMLYLAPLAATVFSMEVISIELCSHSAIVLFSVYRKAQKTCSGTCSGTFLQKQFAKLDWKMGLGIVIFSILSTLASGDFLLILQKAEILYQKYLINPYVRIFVGGVLIDWNYLASGNKRL